MLSMNQFLSIGRYFIYPHYTDEYRARLNVDVPNSYKSSAHLAGYYAFVNFLTKVLYALIHDCCSLYEMQYAVWKKKNILSMHGRVK